ncbi:MAG: ABC transporter ATP-binding protein [Proteobacteria bacterium]|nr:ABC transporter ATP-binding protein [Pseudomonadota bacterium]
MHSVASNHSLQRLTGIRLLISRLLGSNFAWLLLAFVVMLAAAFAANVPALLSGVIVDKVVSRDLDSFQRTLPYLLMLLGSYLAREALTFVRKFAVERTACQLERDELRSLSRFLLHLDLSEFWGERIGGLNVRINRSLEGLIKLVKLLFMDFLPTVALALIALVFTFTRSGLVFGVMAGIAGVTFAITLWQVLTQKGIRLSLFGAKEQVSANLNEVLMGLDYVRAAGGIESEGAKTDLLSEQLRSQEFVHHKAMMRFDSAKQVLEGLGLVIVFGIGVWQAEHGFITKGDVLALTLLFGSVAAPLRELHRIIDEGFEGFMKVGQLADLYNLKPDRGMPGVLSLPQVLENTPIVRAHDLRFVAMSDKRGESELIRGVNMSVLPGEWVGIAGGSGCGKSSFLKIVLGLTPNYTGELEVFGVEVRNAVKSEFWDRVGYVSQHPHIVRGTVRENLIYGSSTKNGNDFALLDALEKAGLHDRYAVRGLSCLDEHVEELGRNLSGGEQQRLAIARLFLRHPSLIVLDEATSALDYKREWQLIQNLRSHFVGVAAIVVAHRLEALRETNRIVVMSEGSIVEEGTFDELSQRDGEFSKIANLGLKKSTSQLVA